MNISAKSLLLTALAMIAGAGLSWAINPTKPAGNAVLDQAIFGLALTKSDTSQFPPTRGIHVGDASSCAVTVVFANNPGVSIALDSVQPGLSYPYSIIQLKDATTCSDIVGLW